jgi:molybdate transport repressor ModE-like protein
MSAKQASPAPTQEAPAAKARPIPERSGWAGVEVRHLRALVALVDSGSMTAAAQALGMAQSTVSEAMSALDRTLGTPAVARRRGARGSDLTAAGRALLPYARRVLAALEDAQTAVAAVTREARAVVDIVANESVSTYLLPEVLAVLRQQWPGTRFSVTVATCQTARDGLAQGKYDVGFLLAAAEAEAEAEAREVGLPLADVRLVLLCGAEHPLAPPGNVPVPRARLAPFRVFTSDSSGDFHALLHGFFHADGLPGPRLEASGTIDAVKRSVLADRLALGVLPEYAVAEELRNGRMRAVPVRPSLPRLRLAAHLCGVRPTGPAAAEVIKVLRAVVGPESGTRSTGSSSERGKERI